MSAPHVRVFATSLLLVTLAGCASVPPEQQLIRDAAEALGGVDRVRAAGVVVLEGTGRHWNLGQDLRPGLADQTFTVSAFQRAIDLDAVRMRTTLTRTPTFAYFQGPQAQTQVQGLDGDMAYNVGANGTPARTSATVAADRRAERLHHPLVLVELALLEGARLSPVRVNGTERTLDVTTDAGAITLVVGADARPVRIESAGTHLNLGDVRLTTTFADYAEGAGGLRLPARVTTKVDDFTTGDYQVTYRAGTESIEAPATVAGMTAPGPAVPNVIVQGLTPDVWLLSGGSHHSVVVAFADRLVMIEAPQSEARSRAAIAKARELRPGTPLTHLVMSHHHFDHSTGLRAAIAEGLTVIAHAGNEAFVKEIAARPFTRMPDALAKSPTPVTVDAVGDTKTISDGTRSLVLYHVAGNPHSDTMLMAYLPKERLLIEVDAFSPGGTYHPYAANLLGHVERLKLNVDRIVPLHGAVATMADLVAAARPAS